MYGKPFKMMGKSPMMKKLIGKQKNLPEELKAKIEASPAKQKPIEPTKKQKVLAESKRLVKKFSKNENPKGKLGATKSGNRAGIFSRWDREKQTMGPIHDDITLYDHYNKNK